MELDLVLDETIQYIFNIGPSNNGNFLLVEFKTNNRYSIYNSYYHSQTKKYVMYTQVTNTHKVMCKNSFHPFMDVY